jgi:CRP-like cAMP-binding protein
MIKFDLLLDALQPSFCHTGDCIIWQGDEGDMFYILEKGECEVVKNGTVLSFKQKVGTGFGELALIHGAPRACTIRATQTCKLWSLNRTTFRRILNDMEQEMNEAKIEFLSKVSEQAFWKTRKRATTNPFAPSFFARRRLSYSLTCQGRF